MGHDSLLLALVLLEALPLTGVHFLKFGGLGPEIFRLVLRLRQLVLQVLNGLPEVPLPRLQLALEEMGLLRAVLFGRCFRLVHLPHELLLLER